MTVTPPGDVMDTESEAKERQMVFTKMEKLVREMQHPETGVPVRSHKTLLTQLPCVFMGYDLIEWLMERLPMEDSAEAIHLANLLCLYGYFFPVPESKALMVKDDGSYYRFQTPYFWPSQTQHLDSTEYAIYLVKRSMRNKQKHGLDECEQETLNRLKKSLAQKWEFVSMQAEEQLKLAKERKKMDKIVMDSQEKAYWKVHWTGQPKMGNGAEVTVPYKNTTSRKKKRSKEEYQREIVRLKEGVSRSRLKSSQAAEMLVHQCEIYTDYDPIVSAVCPSNPWISDEPTYWMLNENIVETPTEKRVRRWSISLNDLLSDPTGIQEFENYLRKEYSHENIRFWKAVQGLHASGKTQLQTLVQQIYEEFVVPGASCEVNLDSRTAEMTQKSLSNPTRFAFDQAQQHVFSLMNKDSYPRFVRSDAYKSILANAIQPSHKKRFFNFVVGGGGGAKKKNSPLSGGGSTHAGSAGNHINPESNLDRKQRDVNLSGSTNDLRVDAKENEWLTGSGNGSNLIAHSLSASNLHDLNNTDNPYRLTSSPGGSSGTSSLSKPKALSTESCNTTPVHQSQLSPGGGSGRSMELTLEVPIPQLPVAPHRSGSLTPDTRRSSASSVVSQEHSPGDAKHNEVCPWED